VVISIITLAGGTVQAAQAAEPQPDVQVAVTAARHILPTDGWSSVDTTVRNTGDAPASNVRVTITLPAELRYSQLSSSSEWDCTTTGWTNVICDHLGDLAPDTSAPYPITLSAYPYQATAGHSVTVSAEVTTSSTDADLSNNSASCAITFVANGVINGRIWNDLNANGIREDNEPLLTSVGISFWSVDDEDLYGASNTFDGTFRFTVPAKKYYAEVTVPKSQWRFTQANVGDDATDSDISPYQETTNNRYGRSAEFTVSANGTTTVDVGLVAVS
jgi:hypothetical protein